VLGWIATMSRIKRTGTFSSIRRRS
jgi:hypothetical protein